MFCLCNATLLNMQAPPAKESFDSGLFPGVDKNMDFNWSGEVSEEKLQIARGGFSDKTYIHEYRHCHGFEICCD